MMLCIPLGMAYSLTLLIDMTDGALIDMTNGAEMRYNFTSTTNTLQVMHWLLTVVLCLNDASCYRRKISLGITKKIFS